MNTISSRYSLVEETPTRIVFTLSGTTRTTISNEVKDCSVLGYTHTYEYSDFRRTTTITPDGYRVVMEVDYRGTVDQGSMWWTIAQFKNAEEPGEFSQGILPSQVTVTNGSTTLPLEYTPHSSRTVGWPNGTINVPYTIIFPLNTPNQDITFRINTYGDNPYGGIPNQYEFWHKDGENAPASIGDYSVVYPRWNTVWGSGFKTTTYEFDWTWRFTP